MFSSGPKYQKLTTNLRLAVNRLKLLEKKKTEMAIKSRREIADYIRNGKEDRARIRVEHIVREDYLVEALEIVEMYCDLLLARMGVVQTSKTLEDGLEEPIASIIWATPRLQGDVQELVTITEQLTLKYGKEFAQSCRANNLNNVNEKLVHKLGIHAPPKLLVEKYMEEIAKSFNIPYLSPVDPQYPQVDLLNQAEAHFGTINNPNGGLPFSFQKPSDDLINFTPHNMGNETKPNMDIGFFLDPASPPQYTSYPPLQSSQPHPNVPYPIPTNGVDDFPCLPAVPSDTVNSRGSSVAGRGDDVNFDDLAKRFEDLKKKR